MMPHLHGKQKGIRICKYPLDGCRFTSMNYEAQKDAMAALRPNTYKVWTYLCSHRDQYELGLSSEVVTKFCHISRGTYDRAVAELIEKGYLMEAELYDGLTGYIFWEGGATQYEKLSTSQK